MASLDVLLISAPTQLQNVEVLPHRMLAPTGAFVYLGAMQSAHPFTKDLVLLGGGHSHALVLRMWAMNPQAGVRLTVINPEPTAAYSGMLPGFVAGHYSADQLRIDLVRLARKAGARVILGAASGIDLGAKTVTVPGRPPVAYDVLSVDVGITNDLPGLTGLAEHGIPAKPLTPFAMAWDAWRQNPDNRRAAVIGAGVAGAEIAMAMAHALQDRAPEITLIDRAQAFPNIAASARAALIAAMARLGVRLIENAVIGAVTAQGPRLADGRLIEAGFTVSAAGARAHPWLAQTGLETLDGYITVNRALQSSDPTVFAVGDCAHMTASPRPKAGVFAVRQAPVLFHNLRAALSGGPVRPYTPQRDYLKLVSLGGRRALAEKAGVTVAGGLMWRWKDRIDRRFMAMFTDIAPMSAPPLPKDAALGLTELVGDAPMCGGCGSKVGRGALTEALAALPATKRDDILSGPGDDAAVIRTGGATQVMTTDHLRAMVDDPVLMTEIAAVHALGDIWAMGATPQTAMISLTLPRMSSDLQRRTLAEVMTTATRVMGDAGAAIVGGHSTMGAEFTLGFALTGLCDRPPIGLGGAQDGDVLILTKPIGSGTIMAAEMRGLARGGDVAACLNLMRQPQAEAAAILKAAHAMTDVTGFGLAGHLGGICEASGLEAQIDLAAIPLMAGAEALAEAGVHSTIFAENRDGAGPVLGARGARGALLFDPQTGGGLLAAVAASGLDKALQQLAAAGYQAAAIGRMVKGAPGITVL